MGNKTTMDKEEMMWRAREDANVMAQYQEILKDKARLNRAVKEANKQAKDMEKRASAMRSVANKGKRK